VADVVAAGRRGEPGDVRQNRARKALETSLKSARNAISFLRSEAGGELLGGAGERRMRAANVL
jgi:hypothetical protein